MQLPKILYNKSVRYILVILVILVLTEVTSYYIILAFSKRGIWIKDAPYHPYLGYIPRSNITMRFGGHCPYRELLNYGYIKTNAEGRSVTPLAYDNPDIIIAITGGGPVFGAVSSSNEKTVPSQLERIINEETRIKAEVINLGVPGYQSFQEMLSLYRFLKTNKVNLIVSLSGLNDAAYGLEFPNIQSASLVPEIYDRAEIINNSMSLTRFLRSMSWTFDLVYVVGHKIERKMKDYLSDPDSKPRKVRADGKDKVRAFDNIIERTNLTSLHYSLMNSLSRENHTQFAVMLMPTAFTKNNLSRKEELCAGSRVTNDIRISNDTLGEYEIKFFNQLKIIPKDYDFYDLTYIFNDNRETMFVDMDHYNDEGALKVAQEIFQRIKPMINKIIAEISSS